MFEDIEFSSQPIDSFGGLVFFERFVEGSFHFDKIVSNILGERPVQAEYSFSDVLYSFMACTVTGGSFAEDINRLNQKMPSNYLNTLCSSDTFLEVLKKLESNVDQKTVWADRDTVHHLCFEDTLNEILGTLASRVLDSNKRSSITDNDETILDHDHTKVYTEKPDAAACYKGKGYYLSVFSIDNIPVYISSQGGNSTPKSELKTVLEEGFKQHNKQELKKMIFRADGACYSNDVLELILKYCKDYIIRSKQCDGRVAYFDQQNGSVVTINDTDYKVVEQYDVMGLEPCRRILYKPEEPEEPSDMFTHQRYQEVITTLDAPPAQIIQMYNQRGASERLIDELKNDYNLIHPPFQTQSYNLAYFIVCAMTQVVTKGFKLWAERKTNGAFNSVSRIKRVIFQLIAVPARAASHAGSVTYKLYSQDKVLRELIL